MRVAIVAPSDFAGSPLGGTSTFLATVVPLLRSELYLVGIGAGASDGQAHRADGSALPVVHLVGDLKPTSGVPHRVQRALLTVEAIKQIRRWAPDVLYVHSAEIAAVLGRRIHAPMVFHMHGAAAATDATYSPHWFARNRLGSALLRAGSRDAIRRSSLVVGVSEDCRRLPDELGVPFAVLPTCVDTELFVPARRPADDGLVVGFVGRLSPVKNLAFIVDVVHALARRGVPVTLRVAGEGPESAGLAARVEGLGLRDRVSMVGTVAHNRLPMFYAGIDVLLLGSHFEGLPTVVLEAMSCGVPVVAPALPGIASVVRDGVDGHLFRDYDADAVSRLAEQVYGHREQYGRPARDRILAHHAASSIAARLEELLLEVCEQRSGLDWGSTRVEAK